MSHRHSTVMPLEITWQDPRRSFTSSSCEACIYPKVPSKMKENKYLEIFFFWAAVNPVSQKADVYIL